MTICAMHFKSKT